VGVHFPVLGQQNTLGERNPWPMEVSIKPANQIKAITMLSEFQNSNATADFISLVAYHSR
jgi:hypothetical protein